MDDNSQVCAIIVTYNGLKWIEKCLNSIEKTTVKTDILVIDNGSTDGTLAFLKEDSRISYLHESKENLGFGKANNIGLRYGYQNGYDYFLLLNQDAWIEEGTIKELTTVLKKHRDFGVVSSLHFNGEGTNLDHLFQTYLDRIESYQKDCQTNQVKELYDAPFVNAACWMMKKETLEKVGVFHPLFEHYGEDDNYIDRLHAKGLKVGIAPSIKIFHDRDSSGVNPTKNDPRKLYSRTLLQKLLKIETGLDESHARKIAKKLFKKTKKKLPFIARFSFARYCNREFSRIFNEVITFQKERSSELDIH